MGLVTDVFWDCPGCGTKNQAQLYGWTDEGDISDPNKSGLPELPRTAIPSDRCLKWNPPCTGCGIYRLTEPEPVLMEFPIKEVE